MNHPRPTHAPDTTNLYTRRDALKLLGAGAALAPFTSSTAFAKPAAKTDPVVGIQMSLGGMRKRGIEAELDDFQKNGAVNTLFPWIHTYVAHYAGFPKEGFVGGNFARPNPQYYKGSFLKFEHMRAPEAGDMDYLEIILKAAKPRGMKTYAWLCEVNTRPDIPGFERVWETNLAGEVSRNHPAGFCYRNPGYQAFQMGMVEDYCRSYEIDGIMWTGERQGPLSNALGAFHRGDGVDPMEATCFCEHCSREAKARGIDVERAKEGFREFGKFIKAGRQGKRPVDGYFVEFWRKLHFYPEILAWNKMWWDGYYGMMRLYYEKTKSVNPALKVGWHVWQNNSWHPFYVAEVDYRYISQWNDFIKPVTYNHVAGRRVEEYAEGVTQNWLGDFSPAEATSIIYQMLGHEKQAPYGKAAQAGWSPQYVVDEYKRIKAAVEGTNTEVWPGIDVDVPWPKAKKADPAETRETVRVSLEAGMEGIVLSRASYEMRPESLRAAGDGYRAWKNRTS